MPVRQPEDFDHFEPEPGVYAERFVPPAWAGKVNIKMLPAAPSAVDTLSRQLDKVIKKAQAKLEKLQSTVETSQQTIEDSKKLLKKRNNHFIEDSEVERQLVLKQFRDIELQNKHREKIAFNPLNIMGLVTKILKKNDNEYHSQDAKDAIALEVNKLIGAGVWDIKPIAKSKAMLIPGATFSRLFGILGIKDFEADSRKFKYRVVLQGSNMKDLNNNDVFFADTSNAPTNMACIRSVIAYSQLSGGNVSQADARQAYIQPKLEDDVYIFVTIPEEMWNDEMKKAAKGINNPVFRLRRPLYGWSRSGNIWEGHLDAQLKSIKHDGSNGKDVWKNVPEWPQTYWKIGSKGKPIILTVYVDDFILGGPGSSDEWPSIQKVVDVTEPTDVGRVLGVHHHFDTHGTLSETTFDMTGYIHQSVDLYNSLDGSKTWPLKNNVHYPWWEPTQHEIETLGTQPGVFGPHSASLLMKALYCGRMVR